MQLAGFRILILTESPMLYGGYSGTYGEFLTKYNQRIAVPSNFTIALNGFNDGLNYTVVATMENVEPYSGTNLVLQFTVTESHLMYSGSEFNYVNRLMVPGASGTPVSFTSGTVQSATLNFSMGPTWITDNCEFVAFIQNNTTKEILQATKVAPSDLMPLYNFNSEAVAVAGVPVMNCSGSVTPEVVISNHAAQALTTLDINYKVNEEEMYFYQWTGSLGYNESESVVLPPAVFNLLENNNLLIYTANPNGNPDEDPTNDTLTSTFISAPEAVPNVYVFIKLDQNPEETTWDLKNGMGEVLFSGGPYSVPQAFIKDTLYLSSTDCYTFTMHDAGGDGLVGANTGFSLRQNDFSLVYENNNFTGAEEELQFAVNMVSVPENGEVDGFNVYPNPFNDYANISFTLKQTETVDLKIFSVLGEVVYTSQNKVMNAGSKNILIDTRNYKPGIYFVYLKLGDKLFSKKISTY